MPQAEHKTTWLWAFAPVNAQGGIFLTLLPLYILNLGGNVVDVGLLTSAYILSLVPGALIWGYIMDVYPRRRGYIVFSYLSTGAALILIHLFTSLSLLPVLLVFYGLVSVAAVPAVNLLIMESFSRDAWPGMIARLSFVSLVGYDAGVIIGFVWSLFYDVRGLIALSAIFALVSGVLVLRLVKEPKVFFERKVLLFSREVFVHRLRALPIVLLNAPTLLDLRRFAKMLRTTFLREVPFLYFSVFIFNFAVYLFSTSYAPALRQNGISENGIFLITLSNTVMQTIVYYYVNRSRFFEHHGVVDTAKLFLTVRFGTILAIGIFITLFQGGALVALNLAVFPILGGSWAFYNTAVSTLVFRTLNPQRQGETLGMYSAIGGLFSFVGTLISGYLSYSLSFLTTFSAAAVLMLLSLLLLGLSAKIGERVRLLRDIVAYG